METQNYNELLNYLNNGIEPALFNSTRGNFLATARNYDVNKNGFLTRNGKIVVTGEEMKKNVFEEFHRCHAGRTSTWGRINAR